MNINRLILSLPFVIMAIYLIFDGVRRLNAPDRYWEKEKHLFGPQYANWKPDDWDQKSKKAGIFRIVGGAIVLIVGLVLIL